MKFTALRITSAIAALFIVSNFSFSQDSRVMSAAGDKYVISAKAGGVNFVEGNAHIERAGGMKAQLLRGDQIEIGDRVSTSQNGKIEVLLNPGSYLRLGPSSTFSFVSTSLDDLKVQLTAGNAMFEVIADDDFRVSVTMPGSEVALTRSGVYRLDVLQDGTSRLEVWKGKAFVGSENSTSLKPGSAAMLVAGGTTVAKFDRDDKDQLEVWSNERAKSLAKINGSLKRSLLRDTLVSSFNGRGWNMYDSFGLWVMDPFRRSWCFLPFGYGWGSPYGYYYGYDVWGIGLPRWIYTQPPPRYIGNPGPGKGPVTREPNYGDTHGRLKTPPYKVIENNERGSGKGVVNRRVWGHPEAVTMPSIGPGRQTVDSSPSVSPAESSPVIAIPRMRREKP